MFDTCIPIEIFEKIFLQYPDIAEKLIDNIVAALPDSKQSSNRS